nr:hypothetical protein [uncultured Methanoregula sp.]
MSVRKKSPKPVVLVLCLTVIAILVGVAWRINFFSRPAEVLTKFHEDNDAPEFLQADVLIRAGTRVEGTVLEEVRKPNAPKRRSLFQYLTVLRSMRALPALQGIAEDASEPEYIRIDALATTYAIDANSARIIATRYRQDKTEFGKYCVSVLSGSPRQGPPRTFWDAFWGRMPEFSMDAKTGGYIRP